VQRALTPLRLRVAPPQCWPPSGDAFPGVIVMTALVDHGGGRGGRRAHEAALGSLRGAGAHAALLAALRTAAPRALTVQALTVPRLDGGLRGENSVRGGGAAGDSPSGPPGSSLRSEPGGSSARSSGGGKMSFSLHPGAGAADALRRQGASGSFTEDSFLDGSVHGGFGRGDDAPHHDSFDGGPRTPTLARITLIDNGSVTPNEG
jgi:hypothetical protein